MTDNVKFSYEFNVPSVASIVALCVECKYLPELMPMFIKNIDVVQIVRSERCIRMVVRCQLRIPIVNIVYNFVVCGKIMEAKDGVCVMFGYTTAESDIPNVRCIVTIDNSSLHLHARFTVEKSTLPFSVSVLKLIHLFTIPIVPRLVVAAASSDIIQSTMNADYFKF